jgi:hypothetical protein
LRENFFQQRGEGVVKTLRYLARSMNILNACMAAALVLFVWFTLLPLLYVPLSVRLPSPGTADSLEKTKTPEENLSPLSDYFVVAEQNIFHPERRIPEKKEERVLPKPEILLYGTIITDRLTVAYVEDKKTPHTTPGRGKRQLVLRKGDSVSGFVLKEINEDQIVLGRGDEIMTVKLHDDHKRTVSDEAQKIQTGQPRSISPASQPAQGERPSSASLPKVPGPRQLRPRPAPAQQQTVVR